MWYLVAVLFVIYSLGALVMSKYMDQWLIANDEEQFFFLTKKLDVIILTFWPCFIVIAVIIEVFGPAEE